MTINAPATKTLSNLNGRDIARLVFTVSADCSSETRFAKTWQIVRLL